MSVEANLRPKLFNLYDSFTATHTVIEADLQKLFNA